MSGNEHTYSSQAPAHLALLEAARDGEPSAVLLEWLSSDYPSAALELALERAVRSNSPKATYALAMCPDKPDGALERSGLMAADIGAWAAFGSLIDAGLDLGARAGQMISHACANGRPEIVTKIASRLRAPWSSQIAENAVARLGNLDGIKAVDALSPMGWHADAMTTMAGTVVRRKDQDLLEWFTAKQPMSSWPRLVTAMFEADDWGMSAPLMAAAEKVGGAASCLETAVRLGAPRGLSDLLDQMTDPIPTPLIDRALILASSLGEDACVNSLLQHNPSQEGLDEALRTWAGGGATLERLLGAGATWCRTPDLRLQSHLNVLAVGRATLIQARPLDAARVKEIGGDLWRKAMDALEPKPSVQRATGMRAA